MGGPRAGAFEEGNCEMRDVLMVDGCRTPFARSGTDLAHLTSYDLGRAAVAGLMNRSGLSPDVVDLLVMGTVIQDPATSNLGREVALGAGLPSSCPAYTVTMACVSSLQSALNAVRAIRCGDADVVIAAGLRRSRMFPYDSVRGCGRRS